MPSDGERGPAGDERPDESERAEVSSQAGRIMTALSEYGDSFLAFLMLDGVDQTDPEIVTSFLESYAGWYPDRMTLMRSQLESLGWLEALADFRRERDLAENVVHFDWDRIWARCLEVYSVEERLAGVHAFFR